MDLYVLIVWLHAPPCEKSRTIIWFILMDKNSPCCNTASYNTELYLYIIYAGKNATFSYKNNKTQFMSCKGQGTLPTKKDCLLQLLGH